MARHFVLTVHLHDRRYHGAGEWPPAPARVFQALVAGAAQGRRVPGDAARALTLLEGLAPPIIAAPVARRGQRVTVFVPNNDLDAVAGDSKRVGEVRTKKVMQPHLLERGSSFLYAWALSGAADDCLPALADGLYQFGRGLTPPGPLVKCSMTSSSRTAYACMVGPSIAHRQELGLLSLRSRLQTASQALYAGLRPRSSGFR